MRKAKKIEGRVATCSVSEAKWSGALVPQQSEREKSELTEESTEGELQCKRQKMKIEAKVEKSPRYRHIRTKKTKD